MTDTVEATATTTAPPRSAIDRASDALADHLHPRTTGMIGGVLLALGLGYAWATLLFLQAHRTQLVVSYGLPALTLTTVGALGLAVARRGGRARSEARGGATRGSGSGLLGRLGRPRIRSSVRTGPPALERIDEHGGDHGRAVVVRDRTPDAGSDLAPGPRPRPTPRPGPTPPPSAHPTEVIPTGPEAPRGRHAWRDEESDGPELVTGDPTTPLARASAEPAPEPAPEPTPEPAPETTLETAPMPVTTPPRTVTVRPAPAVEPEPEPEPEPGTSDEEPAGEDVTPAPAPRVARVRPLRKSGDATARPKRTTRVAGRPSTS
jgi:hypothetical protein